MQKTAATALSCAEPRAPAVRPAIVAPRVWLVVALGLAIAVFNLVTLDLSMSWDGDNALYIAHARNLVAGVAYNDTGFVQNPHYMMSPQAYPPGLAAILAPVYAVFGLDIHALKLCMLAFFLLMLAATTWYFRAALVAASGSPLLYPFCFLGLFGANPYVWSYSDRILSDVPFVVCVYVALAVLGRAYRHPATATRRLGWALGAGIAVYLAIATRIIGLMLLPTIIAYELWHYRRITRVGVIASSVSLLLWLAQKALLAHTEVTPAGSGAGYARMMASDLGNRYAQLPGDILLSAHRYAQSIFGVWFHGNVGTAITIFVLAASVIAFYGFWRRLRTRVGLAEIFGVLYALALLPWSSHYTRYIFPLLPLYFFYLLFGLAALSRPLAAWPKRHALPLVALGVISAGLYTVSYADMVGIRKPVAATAPNSPAALATYRFIRDHTPADAVLVFRKPRILALFTQRQVSVLADGEPGQARSSARRLDYLAQIGAGYAVDGPPDAHHSIDALAAAHPKQFTRIYHNDSFSVYRIGNHRDR